MSARSSSSRARAAVTATIDLVLLTLRGRQVCVLTGSGVPSTGKALVLPWGHPGGGESLDDAAHRIVRKATGARPGWIEQGRAFADGSHPGGHAVSVSYVGVMPWFDASGRWSWTPANSHSGLGERQRRMVSSGIDLVRARTEHAPLAFRLLPKEFTLTDLQRTYESLLGRRLHKASFRRALQAAFLVEPLDEWRGEGRGRPAQLYRYTPRRRTGSRRGVRFEMS